MLLPHYSSDILKEDSVITSSNQQYSNYGTNKNYYAYEVKSGPLIIIENKTSSSFDRTLGVPLIFNLNELSLINIDFVHNQVLPFVREFLCQNLTTDENGTDESSINGENNENIEKKIEIVKELKENEEPQLPADIIVSFEGNQYKLMEMEDQVSFYFKSY